MIEDLQKLEKEALDELAAAAQEDQILGIRTKYLGRKGLLTALLRNISQVSEAEKPLFGKRCNEVKELLNTQIEEALQRQTQRKKNNIVSKENIDVTLPGRTVKY